MRIAVVNGTCRKTGGVESYLEQIIPALVARGNQVACLFNSNAGDVERAIQIPEEVPTWIAGGTDRAYALASLRAWGPNVVYMHSPVDAGVRNCLLEMAPGVFFAHNYYGTCISGMKRHTFPQVRPCEKVFSPACLAHYFPRRCGGLNPLTMLRRYRDENAWLAGLRHFAAIVVASEHMAVEYHRHGFGDRVQVVGLPVPSVTAVPSPRTSLDGAGPLKLLFMGRMENYKGGLILLDALREVEQKLSRRVRLTFAGDGREHTRWETHAETIACDNVALEVKFPGWLSGQNLRKIMETSHLLVLPSLWPEPFGLVGLEAGIYGLPTVAFDVGGISDWLKEGINGHFAPRNLPHAQGLAEAICRCASDSGHYAALSAGAQGASANFTMDRHLDSAISELQRAYEASIAQ